MSLPEPEVWSDETKAYFLLNNAITVEDWDYAASEVRALGLDPLAIPHTDPDARNKLMTNEEYYAKFDRLDRIEALKAKKSA